MERLGKYELVRKLNAGGMAELFLARQSGLGGFEKTVVIKRLLPALATDEALVKMFVNEARIAARLSHPNVTQIYDLGSADDHYFIAMEFVDGHDLAEVQTRAEEVQLPMPPDLALFIIDRVCQGLHHAHTLKDGNGKRLGLVHRDVSPQNVLLSYGGEVKLVDFGIAKATALAAETQAGLLKGKIGYMSPEQCKGQPLDARSDLFSVGILLYELICHRRLFRRQSDFASMRAVLEDPIPPPSAVVDDVPDLLEPIMLKALARDPEGRFQTAQELHYALEEVARDEGWSAGALEAAEYMSRLYPLKERKSADLIAAGPDDVTMHSDAQPADAERGGTPARTMAKWPPAQSPAVPRPPTPPKPTAVPSRKEPTPHALPIVQAPTQPRSSAATPRRVQATLEPEPITRPLPAVPRVPDFTTSSEDDDPTLARTDSQRPVTDVELDEADVADQTILARPSFPDVAPDASVGNEPTLLAAPTGAAAAIIQAAQSSGPGLDLGSALASSGGAGPTQPLPILGEGVLAGDVISTSSPTAPLPLLDDAPQPGAVAGPTAPTVPLPMLDAGAQPISASDPLLLAARPVLSLRTSKAYRPDDFTAHVVTPKSSTRSRVILMIVVPGLLLLAASSAIFALKLRDSARTPYPVQVVTEPAGAAVFVDGQQHFGVTPLTVHGLDRSRPHTLLLMRNGFRPWQRNLVLDGSPGSRDVRAKLERMGPGGEPGSLLLEVNVSGAQVFLDGELRGRTPMTVERVSSGEPHTLVIRKSGYEDERVAVPALAPGEKRPLKVTLEPPNADGQKPQKREPPKKQDKPEKGAKTVQLPRREPSLHSPLEGKIGEHLPAVKK